MKEKDRWKWVTRATEKRYYVSTIGVIFSRRETCRDKFKYKHGGLYSLQESILVIWQLHLPPMIFMLGKNAQGLTDMPVSDFNPSKYSETDLERHSYINFKFY